jgi:hypothetical protein
MLPHDDEDEETQLGPMERGSSSRVLSKKFPTGYKSKDISNWIQKLALAPAKKAKLKTLPVGSVYTEPSQQPHFAMTGNEPVVVLITGTLPTIRTIQASRR